MYNALPLEGYIDTEGILIEEIGATFPGLIQCLSFTYSTVIPMGLALLNDVHTFCD